METGPDQEKLWTLQMTECLAMLNLPTVVWPEDDYQTRETGWLAGTGGVAVVERAPF